MSSPPKSEEYESQAAPSQVLGLLSANPPPYFIYYFFFMLLTGNFQIV